MAKSPGLLGVRPSKRKRSFASHTMLQCFLHKGHVHFGEVQYFTQLPYEDEEDGWTFHNVALVKLYSLPEPDLLQFSSQTLATCILTNELVAIGIKTIATVIAMVPRKLTLRDGEEVERFCALSQPGLDASVLRTTYDIYEDDDGGGGDTIYILRHFPMNEERDLCRNHHIHLSFFPSTVFPRQNTMHPSSRASFSLSNEDIDELTQVSSFVNTPVDATAHFRPPFTQRPPTTNFFNYNQVSFIVCA
ncbi:hypothetical protein J3R82DRAFT_6574 [Butyriboletus roseoflavus]|nr:hypothetical protein J3R82DRAFT_6574 [Butyriboletus roseoflavus]